MRRYFAYFRYLIKHKYYVFKIGRMINISIIQLLKHDLSKFTPFEFIEYANTFCDKDGNKQYEPTKSFDDAWKRHIKYNKHHWEHYVNLETNIPSTMPNEYIKEMLADWLAVELTVNNSSTAIDYYNEHKKEINIDEYTRNIFEYYLQKYGSLIKINKMEDVCSEY